MRKSKLIVFVFSTIFIISSTLISTSVASAKIPIAHGVHVERIGNPTWKPVDFHLFSAQVGTSDTGYEEFFLTMEDLLPPPNHVLIPWTGIFPGTAHLGPYDHEMGDGVTNNGFHEGVQFRKREFTGDMGIWVAWMNVPNPGVTGSSPDFTSGPIIPDRLFPIHVEGRTTHNGKDFNPYLANFDVPKLGDLGYPTYDGQSHFPVFIADTAAFGPPGVKLNGSYDYLLTMVDQDGNGWRVKAHFTVAP